MEYSQYRSLPTYLLMYLLIRLFTSLLPVVNTSFLTYLPACLPSRLPTHPLYYHFSVPINDYH